jgi:hypothetical protein
MGHSCPVFDSGRGLFSRTGDWKVARTRRQECLRYVVLGDSRPLPELFQASGCKFEFNAKTIQPLTKLLREELEKL